MLFKKDCIKAMYSRKIFGFIITPEAIVGPNIMIITLGARWLVKNPMIDRNVYCRETSTHQSAGVPDLSCAMQTLRLTGGTTDDQGRNKEEGEGLIQGCRPH